MGYSAFRSILNKNVFCAVSIFHVSYTLSFYKKTIFYLSLNFRDIVLKNRMRFSWYFSYLFIFFNCLFSWINSNSKRHFLLYMLARASNFATYDGTTIDNEEKLILNKKKC